MSCGMLVAMETNPPPPPLPPVVVHLVDLSGSGRAACCGVWIRKAVDVTSADARLVTCPAAADRGLAPLEVCVAELMVRLEALELREAERAERDERAREDAGYVDSPTSGTAR